MQSPVLNQSVLALVGHRNELERALRNKCKYAVKVRRVTRVECSVHIWRCVCVCGVWPVCEMMSLRVRESVGHTVFTLLSFSLFVSR